MDFRLGAFRRGVDLLFLKAMDNVSIHKDGGNQPWRLKRRPSPLIHTRTVPTHQDTGEREVMKRDSTLYLLVGLGIRIGSEGGEVWSSAGVVGRLSSACTSSNMNHLSKYPSLSKWLSSW